MGVQSEFYAMLKEMAGQLAGQLVGQANILTIPRLFLECLGDLESALLLAQILYWSDKGKKGGGWFYKTYDEWYEELALTKYQVTKAKNKLAAEGLIETKVMKANGNPTVHYRVNAEGFALWLEKNLIARCGNEN